MSGLPPNDPLRQMDSEIMERLIESRAFRYGPSDERGRGPGPSEHLTAEIAWAHRSGKTLAAGEAVPGCTCQRCTGVPDEEPAWTRRTPRAERRREGRERWKALVREARRVPILDVAQRLGLGDPVKRGKEVAVRCPLHDDTDPSCRLDPEGGLWYCDPCGEGGDGILLYMKANRVEFADAVKDLAGRRT